MVLNTILRKSLFHVTKNVIQAISNERKSKKYINFLLQFIFFSQNCTNYPFVCVFKRINILSKKDHLFLVQKKGEYAISRKKNFFSPKSEFFDDFLLISLFSSKYKQKTLSIVTINFFSEKEIINDLFFNVFKEY